MEKTALLNKEVAPVKTGRPFFQPKLTINQPNDVYEQEADAMADKVMRMEQPFIQAKPIPVTPVQRKCAHCEEEEKKAQRKEMNGDETTAGTELGSYIGSLSGVGAPLSNEAKSFYEPRFGADFSNVRIHTDTVAAKSAQSINALAYTSGNNIVFNNGQYSPNTDSGKRLLGHELTHVVQQSQASISLNLQKQDSGSVEVDLVTVDSEEDRRLRHMGINLPSVGPVRSQNIINGNPWRRNGRRNTQRASGFNGSTSGTYIRAIDVYINPAGYSIAELTWDNLSLSPGFSPLTILNTSPGAGNCSADCSTVAGSQIPGSHCTSLSPPQYVVEGFSPALGSYPSATYVTWYNYAREIAFHYFDVPDYPASHGCTRLSHDQNGAELVYDNSLPSITIVTINRDAGAGLGPKCWRGRTLVNRP